MYDDELYERADKEMMLAGLKATAKHVAPAFALMAVAVAVWAVTWPLAVYGAAHLPGPWNLVLFALIFLYIGVGVGSSRHTFRVALREQKGKSTQERMDEARSKVRADGIRSPLRKKRVWARWVLVTVPRYLLAGFALTVLGLPGWLGLALAVLGPMWVLVSVEASHRSPRLREANQFLTSFGEEKNTPEI